MATKTKFPLWGRDPDGYGETWRLLEAGIFSSATAEVLSYAAGRERPDGTRSPNQWRQGGDSFPSLHASAAFAVGGGWQLSYSIRSR